MLSDTDPTLSIEVPEALPPEVPEAPIPIPVREESAPSVGLIVRFVLSEGPNAGEERAAVVVRVNSPTSINLQVFYDGTNDGEAFHGFGHWKTSVPYSADPKPGTWHL